MKLRLQLLSAVVTAAFFATGTAVAGAAPAQAAANLFTITGTASCAPAGGYNILWHLKNQSDGIATIADVVARPEGTTANLPTEVYPKTTQYGSQYIPERGYATITFNATWSDGTTTEVSAAYSPVITCPGVSAAA
jgi:hypothetical protein